MSSRGNIFSGRIAFVQLLFVAAFLLLIGRLFYIQIYQDTFLKEKHSRAVELQELMRKRHERLDSIMSYLAKYQALFFEKGDRYLLPLLQKDLA